MSTEAKSSPPRGAMAILALAALAFALAQTAVIPAMRGAPRRTRRRRQRDRGVRNSARPPRRLTVAATSRELAVMAIANARAEQELRELADTQAALQRLAILVARGEPPEVVFPAATREALRHFGAGTARMIRYELDGTATLVANEGTTGPHVRV